MRTALNFCIPVAALIFSIILGTQVLTMQTSLAQPRHSLRTLKGTPKTKIELTITGGPHAGHYASISTKATCSCSAGTANTFGNQYSLESADSGLSALQVFVDDKEKALKGTTKFYTLIRFGKMGKGDEYIVDTRDPANSGIPVPPTGSGTLVLSHDTGKYVAKISGKTSEGIKFDVVLTCEKVQVMIDGHLIEE